MLYSILLKMTILHHLKQFAAKTLPDTSEEVVISPVYATKSLFLHFTPEQYKILRTYFKKQQVTAGTQIIQEGETSQSLYIIEEGAVEALKILPESQQSYRLNVMQKGECFGELSLLDQQTRSASIRALQDSKLLMLDKEAFEQLKQSHLVIYNLLLENLASEVTMRLRTTNQITVTTLEEKLVQTKERTAMAVMMSYIIFLAAAYALLTGVLHYFATRASILGFVTIPLVLLIGAITITGMLHSKIPMKFYGFSVANWQATLWESFIWSVPFIAFITLLKWGASQLIPELYGVPVFQLQLHWSIILYLFSAILQEIIIRGGIQSPLMYFVPPSRYRNFIIIMITSIMFASIHGHLSFWYTSIAFIPSVFWSILYLKQRSLIGVCFSHFLIGIWAIQILGIQSLLLK